MNNPFLTQSPHAVKYLAKAVASFNSKLNIFLYASVRKGEIPINWHEFQNFELILNNEKLKEYIEIYWQNESVDENLFPEPYNTINKIYKEIEELKILEKNNIEKQMEDYVKNKFPFKLSINEFEKIISEDQCYYCKTTIDQIKQLVKHRKIFKKQITRGWSMEIDRREPNLEYFKDNCVPCCYWCNNAKTDEFNEVEFLKIAPGIRQIWEDRLSKS